MGADLGTAVLQIDGDFGPLDKRMAGLASQLNPKLSKVGKAAGIGLGAGIAGAFVAGKFLYNIGAEFDTAFDKIRVGTGKTGKNLKGLKRDFKGVVSGVPADFESASTAITGLNQRLGLTGKPLRGLSKQMLELSRITETDVGENVKTVTRLFGDWGIKTGKQGKTLDKLFRASQATGIGISTLSDFMVQFGSPLRQMGFDFDTAAAMFSKFEKEGVNLQTAMPGLRMALKNFASEGKDPAKALSATIDKIKSAGSTAKANTMAFEIFGTRAGPDLAAAITEGRFDFDKLIKTIAGGRDTIRKAGKETMDFTEHWEVFKNRVMVKLEPLASKVFGKLGDAMERVGDILTDKKLSNSEKFSKVFDMITNAASDALSIVASRAGQLAPKAAEAFARGFMNASIWGKLAIGGFLLTRLAPLQSLVLSGSKAGTSWAQSFAANAASGSTYELSRSFGRGRFESAIAQSGAFGSAGFAASRSFAASFAASAGPAVAAIGLGNIATSAFSKDWQDAGFEAGGALAGGIAGFMLGGPLGAMLGVGIGSIGGELGSKLFDGFSASVKHLSPLQQRLQAGSKHLANAFRDQKGAVKGLAQAHGNLQHAEQRQKATTGAVHRAEAKLSADRRKYGADSNRVKRDELLLAAAKRKNAAATKEVNQASRLSGAALKLYNHLTVVSAASTKNRIRDLRQEANSLFRKWQQDKSNNDLAKRSQQRYSELNREQRKLSNLYEEAGAKSGPRLQHTIERLNAVQANYGKHLKGLNALQAQLPHKSQSATDQMLHNWGHFTDVFKQRTAQPFKGDVKSMGTAASAGMGEAALTANRILKGFGVAITDFHINPKGEVQKRQGGGFIVPGNRTGDHFKTALPPDSFILNRKATEAFGFSRGGLMPVALESKERAFLPHEVKAMGGPATLEAMNRAAPRFQKGGQLRKPVLMGARGRPARHRARAAVEKVYKGAKAYLDKHRPEDGAAFGPKGVGSYKGVPMANWVIQALQYAASKGAAPQPTSGYRSHAQNVAEGRTYFSEHEKTQYPGGAVDFGGYTTGLAAKMSVVNATKGFKYPLLAPIGFRDDGHASGTGHQLGGLIQRLAKGGWVTVGSTLDPSMGQAPTYNAHSGMSFAELLVAGANAGLKSEALYRVLGIPQSSSYPYGMPMGTAILARHGNKGPMKLWKNDVGSGQAGDPHYKIDLHSAAMNALGAQGNADIQVAKLGTSADSGEHSFKEDVPAVYRGCRTGSLSFPSMPKSLHGVEREIKQRQGEIAKYRRVSAHAGKENKPGIEQALQKNITALHTRLTQLSRERSKLRFEKAKKRITRRLGRNSGRSPAMRP